MGCVVPSQVPTSGVDLEPHGLALWLKLESGHSGPRVKHCCPLAAAGQRSRALGDAGKCGWGGAEPCGCQDPKCAVWGTAKDRTGPAFDFVKGQLVFSSLPKGSSRRLFFASI